MNNNNQRSTNNMNANTNTNQNSNLASDSQNAAGSFTETLKAYADKAKAMGQQYLEQAKEQISHLQHETKPQTDQASTLASNQNNAATATNTQQPSSNFMDDINSLGQQSNQPAGNAGNLAGTGMQNATRSSKKAASQTQL
ncbi:hypothetical protein DFQ27_006779 [Actinomortierella ambigua]|uniref:Uncharacterized protein n=1 Tax=Actinomortierella ambigua TaxID=1343610 RepID=A0A9P6QH21_9FUNG|nr:hypothetical protein DFQ27_006779 [Actinomortierella ambigua]